MDGMKTRNAGGGRRTRGQAFHLRTKDQGEEKVLWAMAENSNFVRRVGGLFTMPSNR